MENTENLTEESFSEEQAVSSRTAQNGEKPRKSFFISDFFNRLNAGIIDFLIFLGGVALVLFVADFFKGEKVISGVPVITEPALVMQLKCFVIGLWFFFAVITRDAWGYSRSVGKRFCNLKIFAVRSPKPRFYHTIFRNLTILFPAIVIFVAMALAEKGTINKMTENVIVWSSYSVILLEAFLALIGLRRIGDLIAGTKVIFFKENVQKNYRYNRFSNENGGNNYQPRYRNNNYYRNNNGNRY
ncbi:RDD family protein [bacterium]|nr:RDD family protein [bacterium]